MRSGSMRNLYRIRVFGLNLDRFVNFVRNNYKVYNLCRISHEELIMEISYNSYFKLLSKIDSSCYNITIEKVFGYKYFLSLLRRNVALIVSLTIVLSTVLFLSTRLLRINIYGANSDTRQEILRLLEDRDVSIMGSNNITIANLEKDILENVDTVSMVSAMIKGNVLIVNVKEKLPKISMNFADVLAPCNMIIESIDCYQGTSMKKAGEIVRKGELIIGAYDIVGDEKIAIEPIYDISYTTYITGTVEFHQITKKMVRTGHKIVDSCYNMFGNDFLKTYRKCEYSLYDVEHEEMTIFENMFLPLVVKKTTYYELEEVSINHDFEQEKERLLLESEKIAESKIIPMTTIVSTTQDIVDMGTKRLVQTHIELKGRLTND